MHNIYLLHSFTQKVQQIQMFKEYQQLKQNSLSGHILGLLQFTNLDMDQIQHILSASPIHYLSLLYHIIMIQHGLKFKMERDNYLQEMAVMQRFLQEARGNMISAAEDMEQYKIQIDEVKMYNSQMQIKVEEMSKQIESLKDYKSKAELQNQTLKTQIQKLQYLNFQKSQELKSLHFHNSQFQDQNSKIIQQKDLLESQIKQIEIQYQNVRQESFLMKQHLQQCQKLYKLQQSKIHSFIQHYNNRIYQPEKGNSQSQQVENTPQSHEMVYKSLNIDQPVVLQGYNFNQDQDQEYGEEMVKQQPILYQLQFNEVLLQQEQLLKNQRNNYNDNYDKESQFYRQCRLSCVERQSRPQQSQFQQSCLLLNERQKMPNLNLRQRCQTDREIATLPFYHHSLNRQVQTQKKLSFCSQFQLTIQPHQNIPDKLTISEILSYQQFPVKIQSAALSINWVIQQSFDPYVQHHTEPPQMDSVKQQQLQFQAQALVKNEYLQTEQDNNPQNHFILTKIPSNTSNQAQSNHHHHNHHDVQYKLACLLIRQCLAEQSCNQSIQMNEINPLNPLTQSDKVSKLQNMNHILPSQIHLHQYITNYHLIQQQQLQSLLIYHKAFIKFIKKYRLNLSLIDLIERHTFKKPKHIKHKLYLIFARRNQQETVFVLNASRLHDLKDGRQIMLQYNNDCIDSNNFKFGQSEIIISGNGRLIINRSQKKNILQGMLEDGDWLIQSYIDFKAIRIAKA